MKMRMFPCLPARPLRSSSPAFSLMGSSLMIFPLLALSLLTGCKTTTPAETTSFMEDATSIQIECRNEKTLQTSILQQLRSIRAKDIIVNSFGEELDISAAFRVLDTPPSKVYEMGDELQNLGGVFSVRVEKSRTVVRQP